VADPTRLPERSTLRYWPWLVLCLVGIVAFGLLAWLAVIVVLNADSTVMRVIAAIIALGLALLVGYSLLSLRTRSVLDRTGSTAHGATSKDVVRWTDVERLDVVHSLPGWAVRAWSDGRSTIVYICHDTRGRRPTSSSHDTPPPDAPASLHTGYLLVSRYWTAAKNI
jgi:hypothetical protein